LFKLEINRRWGPTAARAWAPLIIYRYQILKLGFDDEMELGKQALQRWFYYSRYVCNGHGNGRRPNGRN
jgi:hypothetical protein